MIINSNSDLKMKKQIQEYITRLVTNNNNDINIKLGECFTTAGRYKTKINKKEYGIKLTKSYYKYNGVYRLYFYFNDRFICKLITCNIGSNIINYYLYKLLHSFYYCKYYPVYNFNSKNSKCVIGFHSFKFYDNNNVQFNFKYRDKYIINNLILISK